MEKEKIRKLLNFAILGTATTALVLVSFMLCYMCINLYIMDCEEEFAAILVGIILTGTISGLLYLISVVWKEIREKS